MQASALLVGGMYVSCLVDDDDADGKRLTILLLNAMLGG